MTLEISRSIAILDISLTTRHFQAGPSKNPLLAPGPSCWSASASTRSCQILPNPAYPFSGLSPHHCWWFFCCCQSLPDLNLAGSYLILPDLLKYSQSSAVLLGGSSCDYWILSDLVPAGSYLILPVHSKCQAVPLVDSSCRYWILPDLVPAGSCWRPACCFEEPSCPMCWQLLSLLDPT